MTREKLQLVGVTSFLVAAKQEEPHPPHPDDCAYWTDHGKIIGVYMCVFVPVSLSLCVCVSVCLD